MLSFIIPTRNRPQRLARTLHALGALSSRALARDGGAEVVIADNASVPPVSAPVSLGNDLPVRVLHLHRNAAAAARNDAARAARGDWLVMLDDDSHPLGCGFVDAMLDAPSDVAAVAAEIVLPDGRREAGGLPEVIVGCAAAIRRQAFLDVGGYDASFHFYVEEYDLCAKLLLDGWRVAFDRRFRALHEKTSVNRNMPAIMRRLTRNNAWIAARYAPRDKRRREVSRAIRRYGLIALKERAELGWLAGACEAVVSLRRQRQREMPEATWRRFTGLHHAHEALAAQGDAIRSGGVAIVHRGKNDWAVEQALHEIGARVAHDPRSADVLVVGTLSPGPMLDALETATEREAEGAGRPVVAPWLCAAAPSGAIEGGQTASTMCA